MRNKFKPIGFPWKRWFAWHPVFTLTGRLQWMTHIARQRVFGIGFTGDVAYRWRYLEWDEYKHLESTCDVARYMTNGN